MKRLQYAFVAVLLVGLSAACSNDAKIGSPGAGGTTGTGGTTGAGGTTGSGGTSGTTGAGGTAGSSGGTSDTGAGGTGGSAGSAGTGGTAGAAGSTSTGGTAGTAGVAGTAGTTGTAGATGKGGTGGTAGAAGSAGAGGTGGSGGTGGGTVTVTQIAGVPNTYGETLASSWILMPCYAQMQQDCVTIQTGASCPNQTGPFEMQGLTQTEAFTLGGTSGTMYNLTFTVNGIAEAKYYMNGMRDAGTGVVTNAQDPGGTDTFYRGGAPVAVEHYNIYKMIVKKPDGSELQHYYLNSFPQTTTAYENHQTFPIHYQKTIPVVGGGSVELYVSDSNCRAVDNCGPGVYAGTCTASRNVPAEPNLVVPQMYMGKMVTNINVITHTSQPYHSQLIHITVNAVAPM